MKKLLILLAAIVVFVPYSQAKGMKETEMTYMSFNIRFITPQDVGDRAWTARRGPALNMINQVKPDVIGIQEQSKEWVDYLVENMPDYEFYIPDYVEKINLKRGFSMVIMWKADKYVLLDAGRFFLTETPDKPSKGWESNHYRTTSWVYLKDKTTGRKFYCFNTHLDHKSRLAKENGVLLNVEMMKSIAGKKAPVFICGDMNIYRENKGGVLLDPFYEYMQSADETALTSYRVPTFNGYNPDMSVRRRIDYIFYRNAQALEYKVIDSPDYGVEYISDHYPIITRFKFK